MNTIKNFGIIICIIASSCSILELIYPNGNMEKIMKFITSAFIIYSLVFSISNISKINIHDFIPTCKSDNKYNKSFFNKLNDQTNEKINQNLLPIINKYLNDINVHTKKINVIMDTKDKSSISIIKIQIFLDKENIKFKKEVNRIISENTGLPTEVIEY